MIWELNSLVRIATTHVPRLYLKVRLNIFHFCKPYIMLLSVIKWFYFIPFDFVIFLSSWYSKSFQVKYIIYKDPIWFKLTNLKPNVQWNNVIQNDDFIEFFTIDTFKRILYHFFDFVMYVYQNLSLLKILTKVPSTFYALVLKIICVKINHRSWVSSTLATFDSYCT